MTWKILAPGIAIDAEGALHINADEVRRAIGCTESELGDLDIGRIVQRVCVDTYGGDPPLVELVIPLRWVAGPEVNRPDCDAPGGG